jgi:hypothetical protein
VIRGLKAERGGDIWLCGGRYDPAAFRRTGSTPYESRVVIAEYERVRPPA